MAALDNSEIVNNDDIGEDRLAWNMIFARELFKLYGIDKDKTCKK